MTRGGTFPRWRWRRSRLVPFATALGTSERGAMVMTVGPWGWWLASVGNVWTGTKPHSAFPRRCDAKRWCEWMLATIGEP